MRALWKSLVLVAAVGCGAAEDEYPPLLDQAGDPCRASHALCVDDETARECIDGTWTDRSCDEADLCAASLATPVSLG
jgi:hypothetical protein